MAVVKHGHSNASASRQLCEDSRRRGQTYSDASARIAETQKGVTRERAGEKSSALSAYRRECEMSISWDKVKLRQTAALARLSNSRVVPLSQFRKVKTVRDTDKPFQYIVQIETSPKRGGDSIFRTITVSESNRGALGDILKDAADALMNSPIAARENLVEARIIKAQRFQGD